MSISEEAVRIQRSAIPPAARAWPGIAWGILQALSTIALLACSAFLITRAAEQPALMYLSMAIVGVRAFALGKAVFRYLERLSSHDAVFRQLAQTRGGVLDRLLPLAPDGLGGLGRGRALSALVQDVDELQNAWLRALFPMITAGSVALLTVGLMAFVSPPAAIIVLVAAATAVLAGILVNGLIAGRAERRLAPLRAHLSEAIMDLLGRLDVLVAFDALPAARTRIDAADGALTAALTRRSIGAGAVGAALALCAGLAVLGVAVVAAPQLSTGLTGPAFAVLVLVPLAVFEILAQVPLAVSARRSVRAAAESVARTAPETRPAEIPAEDSGTRTVPPAHTPEITLEGLRVRWPGAAEDVVQDASAVIRAGERVWIEGPSGSGKSTIAHALVRFLDHGGRYLLDGVPARDYAPADVRTIIGLVEQEPYLFDDSVRQNLLFARPEAENAELWTVLERVGLDDWVRERGGLDAAVGERGALVSGGQAQRLGLARALLRRFPVVIVDEPTAGVDPERADALLRDILRAGSSPDTDARSVILISHDRVPAALVDQHLRLVDGRLGPA